MLPNRLSRRQRYVVFSSNMDIVRHVSLSAFLALTITFACIVTAVAKESVQQESTTAPCIEDGRFYRNPNNPNHRVWINSECAKYYLCLGGEVFEFKCSIGLLFDVKRQICDFKLNVDNCDVAAIWRAPKPLLEEADCSNSRDLGCADGTCLPSTYFCDGSVDCPDESDEEYCDMDNDPNAAKPCDLQKCHLPECYCSRDGTLIPNNMDVREVPQMITITFDDAVNVENWDLYTKELFTPERVNPNGCPIRANYYISHQYTNYRHVQKLWNDGHEIAVHSITHRGPEEWWSHNATIEDWFDEMVGQANIINKFAGVHMDDIKGLRVPFLRVGWNRQFLMMREFGFVYDASMVAPFSDPPLWPYTLDYKMPHKCHGVNQKCPSRSHPGVWELPLNQLYAEGYTCAMIDSCPPTLNGDEIYRMLHHNLQRHMNSNRAPLGLYIHATWFKNRDYLKAFKSFMDDILKMPDVWFVKNWQVIQWMQQPKPIARLSSFEPWSCAKKIDQSDLACNLPNTCQLISRVLQGERYLTTCFDCPEQYPWIRNEFGQN